MNCHTCFLMIIRPFNSADLAGLLGVQAKSLSGESWNAEDYLHLNRQSSGLILVAEEPDDSPVCVVGFSAMRRLFEHAEILNLAVEPVRRRLGTGRALLAESCARLQQAGAHRVFLEVRPSNQAALQLYYSAGFTLHSIRKDYYSQPLEDAYVLMLRASLP